MKKAVTTLGLAVVAAFALTAFLGVSMASAAVCSTSGTGAECTTGTELANGSTIVATNNGVITLTSGFINVTCAHSEVKLEITNNTLTATQSTGKVELLTFSECHSNANTTKNSCSASTTASTSPWHAIATATGGGNGKLDVSNVTGSFTCNAFGSNTKCNYTATTVGNGATPELAFTGSDTTPVLTASNVTLTKEEGSGFLCSGSATWEGVYHVTSPKSLWLY